MVFFFWSHFKLMRKVDVPPVAEKESNGGIVFRGLVHFNSKQSRSKA